MKKLAVLGMGACIALAFSSCKSSESAYKKAYEKAKQQELAEPQTTAPAEEVAPVVTAPVEAKVVESAPADVRQEKVTVVSGGTGLKTFSVVCGAYSVKGRGEARGANYAKRNTHTKGGRAMKRLKISSYIQRTKWLVVVLVTIET